jgi:hypothetical protein
MMGSREARLEDGACRRGLSGEGVRFAGMMRPAAVRGLVLEVAVDDERAGFWVSVTVTGGASRSSEADAAVAGDAFFEAQAAARAPRVKSVRSMRSASAPPRSP